MMAKDDEKKNEKEPSASSFAELIEGDPHTRRIEKKKEAIVPAAASGKRRPPSPAPTRSEPTADASGEVEGVFRGSIPPKDFSELRSGRIRPGARVDLHRLDRKQAQHILRKGLAVASASATACVIVIHGRGLRSPGGEPTLKSALPGWLRSAPLDAWVRGFAPALPRDGGDGATYVLLRKSPAARRRSARR